MRSRNRKSIPVGPLTRIEFSRVEENTESGRRESALKQKWIENGWLAGPDQDLKHQAEFVLMKWTQPSSHTRLARGKWVVLGAQHHTHRRRREGRLCTITTLRDDLAKNVFQLHGVDARGRAVLSRTREAQSVLTRWRVCRPCVIGWKRAGVRSTGGGAFEQARAFTVKLMSPKYVSLVKTNKNDGPRCGSDLRSGDRPTMHVYRSRRWEQAECRRARTRSLFRKTPDRRP